MNNLEPVKNVNEINFYAAALISDALINAAIIIFAAALLFIGNTFSTVSGLILFLYIVVIKSNILSCLSSISNAGKGK